MQKAPRRWGYNIDMLCISVVAGAGYGEAPTLDIAA